MRLLKPAAHSEPEGVIRIDQGMSKALECFGGLLRQQGGCRAGGQGEAGARRPENTGQLGASGHSPGRMHKCLSYSGDKREGTDGKHLSERGIIAGFG